jgi:hypothetical protein
MARPVKSDRGSAGDRQRFASFIRPELWKRLKMLALERDLPVFVMLEQAVERFLDQEEAVWK